MDQQDLIRKVTVLWRQVHKALEAKDPSPWLRLNLTRGQLRILFLLSVHGRMSPGAVAGALGVPKANVTGIIDRLARQGLVSREQDFQDRRSYILRLTDKGRDEVTQLREWFAARMGNVLHRMTPDEVRDLARALETLLSAAQRGKETPVSEATSTV